MSDLYQAYLNHAPELAEFFAAAPGDLFSRPPEARAWDPALVESLRAYQQYLGHGATLQGTEPAIVTGQQPGIFTGPLYTLYKAATALRLAEQLTRTFQRPVVPIFWVAGDDHDLEESAVAHFLTKQHEVLTLHYVPEEPVAGLPMYRVPLSAALHGMIDELAAQTPGSEFRGEVAQFLHDSLDASSSVADWFARVLARLFQGTPLLIFSPHLPAARRIMSRVIAEELRQPLLSTRLLNHAGQRIERLGFAPQLVKGPTECGFFLEMGERRRKVTHESGRFYLPEEDLLCSQESLLALLEIAPERFSPNAALRCIAQQALFPAAAYVAGPGEISYWAQLKGLFEAFGKSMPVVYPRARAVLTTAKLSQLRQRFAFSHDELRDAPERLFDRALERTAEHPGLEALGPGRSEILEAFRKSEARLEQLGAGGQSALQGLRRIRGHLDGEWARLEKALLRENETQASATRRQVARLCNALAPYRKPQERVLNIFSFLFAYGWELVPRITAALDIESFALNEVEL